MLAGHVVKRGTRLVSSLQPGLSTRCTYTTGQDVTLWPLTVSSVGYFRTAARLPPPEYVRSTGSHGESALRITLGAVRQGRF